MYIFPNRTTAAGGNCDDLFDRARLSLWTWFYVIYPALIYFLMHLLLFIIHNSVPDSYQFFFFYTYKKQFRRID